MAGAGSWSEPRVRVFGGSGSEKASFLAFDSGFQGGVRVATGDTNGDGKAEIVVGAGQGGPPVVRVFDAAGQRKASFFAFDSTSTSGIYVAAGDLDDDGNAEIVVGAGATGEVRVFDASGNLRTSFSAYHPIPYTEGVHVAVGDVNGDGNVEIVTGPGRVRPVDVGIFTGDGRWTGSFRVHPDFQGGIYIAVPAALGPRLHLSAEDARAVEGQALRVSASLVDPLGGAAPEKFAATVVWGADFQSQAAISALGGGRYRIEATRRYPSYGRYRIAVRVADVHLRGAVAGTVARIADAPLVARGRAVRTSGLTFGGVIAVLRDGDRFGTVLDLSARVLWGDGSRSGARIVETGGGRFRILGRHTYGKPGVYRVAVRIRSAGGSRGTARSSVRAGRETHP